MANNMDKLAKELRKELLASDERKPKPYDTQAEVIRVEDGTAWVHIPGGVDETPVKLTIDAKKGDIVNVHIAGGSAWITGNSTRPPTDDVVANHAVNISYEVKQDVTNLNTTVTEEFEATNSAINDVSVSATQMVANTQDTVDDLTDIVTSQTNDISNLQELVKTLASSQDLESMTQFVNNYLGENGVMRLDNTGILISQGKFQLLITSDRLIFQENGEAVAYLSNQELNITSASIASNLTLGKFKWVVGENRLTLMRV